MPGEGYDLEIERVLADGDELVVIARLDGGNEGGNKQVVSDNIVINAPRMDVRHVIVGERPTGAYNEQYRYARSMSDIDRDFGDAQTIYER